MTAKLLEWLFFRWVEAHWEVLLTIPSINRLVLEEAKNNPRYSYLIPKIKSYVSTK